MTGPLRQALAARTHATAVMSRHQPAAQLVGVLVLDAEGKPSRIVAPFASESTARQWVADERVASFVLLPAEIANGRRG